MTNTNGHGPKTAVLYARVSTDEQARSGYSLAQQLEALGEYAACEGYQVLEEVADPGQSGASLERPGMDRVRDLVAAGGVSVVLAQDRDRFAREPAYHYSTKLRALNDREDDSPEGQLTDGILDQLAKFERAKTAERTRRGKLRKAREGKVIAGPSPDYGFLYNERRDNYVIDEDKMPVVRRIFEMIGAEGQSLWAVKKILERERIPTPSGARYWSQAFLRICVQNDAYRPRPHEEVVDLVSEEVAAKLDPGRSYGIWWYGKQRHVQKQSSTIGPNGERSYRKSKRSTWNPKDEWIAIPIPDAGIPCRLVDAARENLKERLTRKPSMAALRFWELSGGILRCGGCGWTFSSVPVSSKGRPRRYYYRCPNRAVNGLEACQMRTNYRAEKIEGQVWKTVSDILTHPERLRTDLEEMIDQKRENNRRGDPELERKAWMGKLAETDSMRSNYQEQTAKGLMTIDELAARLEELEGTRRAAERELAILKYHQEGIERLERDKNLLLEHYASMAPEALDSLTAEERHQVYKMLRLKVIAHLDGAMEVAGDLVCISGGGEGKGGNIIEEGSNLETTS
ncbi:MAG TPA: recombinase family protein [Rubrobacter sp.]|nr:recombinase family protein [Rubrobacter sp.]